MIPLLGWISALLLTFCGVPLCLRIYLQKKVTNVSWLFVLMWFGGEATGFIYVIHAAPTLPLLANYLFNLGLTVCLAVLLLIYGERCE